MSTAADRLDRRGGRRGDERRTAILTALDQLLREGVELEDIQIAEVSRRAGVTRSAFYFYFENKALAAAALMDRSYTDAAAAAEILRDTTREPEERFRAAIQGLLHALEGELPQYLAMLDARGPHQAVRELWDADRNSFVPALATMIRTEREAGRAPDGADPDELAALLLELNDRVMETHARGGGQTTEARMDALVSIWVRSIYG